MNLGKDRIVKQIVSRLAESEPSSGAVKVDGTWGSYAPLLAVHISNELKRPILYICPHIDDADNVTGDLQVFSGRAIETFPVSESPEYYADATDEISSQRLRVALGLSEKDKDFSQLIMVTSIQALNQPVAKPDLLRDNGLTLQLKQTVEPELVTEWLIDNGFEHVDIVDLPGQFARRGGIIDIFAPLTTDSARDFALSGTAEPEPVRIEFFGDQIESIRRFDLDTKRSKASVESICIIAASGSDSFQKGQLLIDLLPQDTIIILEEPIDIAEVSDVFLKRLEVSTGLFTFKQIYEAVTKYTNLEICRFASGDKSEYITLDVGSAQQYEHKSGAMWKSNKAVLEELFAGANQKQVYLYCENSAEVQRITEILEETHKKMPEQFHLPIGFINRGFIINSFNTIVIGHHEIFGQYSVRRRIRTIRSASPVESLLDLQKGDYVVHVSYGIGKFRGIQTMEKSGSKSEYLTIEFADKALVHVPVRNIALVQKFIGSSPKRPPLSKISTKKWQRQKERVTKGVQELAAELLEVQARREQMGGFAFDPDSVWQKEFEESFIYQETPDQLTVIEQIKDDMTDSVPMDRLLCGDVGYGKTELAMRAAFKAVESGKQVAVLVPTTVLCIQHGRTFNERFADFPVRIETLNRFVTGKKAKTIVTDTKRGRVDILIGTHRLLSSDIGFKNLGLLIIDEEQRFGVEHKERLKRFRVNVDVLTMTATPIPRTLHLSMIGLRDISSLSTPPLDRRSIVTKVCRYNKNTIRNALIHELNRDGQVFFVHNRVRSIERVADEVRKIINDPDVTITVAHGQMSKSELEGAMISFVLGKTDILVCSTIIESGLDIPNANTMIINDADRFGLAQLHQLRGRVGRYKHRAYAYMLLPISRSVTPVAARRLKAIEEYSQLGAGFRIALRDLEIRGAGNILGAEQSGHINTVGYEMYCRLLSNAVKELKNEPVKEDITAVVDLGFSTYIPKSYIPSDRQRMDVYRRIAIAATAKDLKLLCEELTDLYGPVPAEVRMLIDLTEIRIAAAERKIKSIFISGPDLVFSFEDEEDVSDLFARAPGKVRIPDKKTVHLRLEKNYFQPDTLMSVLRKLLK